MVVLRVLKDKLLKIMLRPLGTRVILAMMLALFAVNLAGADTAYAETRSLKLYFIHTGEKATITFKKNGRYIKSGLKKLNRFLRDFRRNEPTKMDPHLFDLIWEVYKETGSRKYIHVISGFRSLKTNNMLRKKGRGVAKRSQHTQGRGMDFFIPGVSLSKLRAIGLRKGIGGVGYYPRSGSPFVHMDTGRIRHWPRMTRRQLKKVFPRGRTLHVPSDGKPLPNYKQAQADAKRRKSGKVVYTAGNSKSKGSDNRSFIAKLFNPGGGSDEEEDNVTTTTTPRQVKSISVKGAGKTKNAIDSVIAQEKRNPTKPLLSSVPLPKFAQRDTGSSVPTGQVVEIAETNQANQSIEEQPENGSSIGDLIAAIPTPRPKNTIDKSIEADENNPIVAAQEEETPTKTSEITVASLAPVEEKRKSAITNRIENALLASDEVLENIDDIINGSAVQTAALGTETLPFATKNIDVEAERAMIASLVKDDSSGKTEKNASQNSIDDVLLGVSKVTIPTKKAEPDEKTEETLGVTVADSGEATGVSGDVDPIETAALPDENPLLKDRQDIENEQTSVDTKNAPLPRSRPTDDEVLYNKLVAKLEKAKRSAYDDAVSEEKASIPDLALGDLEDKNTILLAFQKDSIAEVALMRAPAYGQNMIKLAPSRVLKGSFHNDFDIAPTNKFAAAERSQNLASVRFD